MAQETETRTTWSSMLAELSGRWTTIEAVEAGIAGVDLMPAAALLAGAGPTGGDPQADLRALIRTTAGLPHRLVGNAEAYLEGGEKGSMRGMIHHARGCDSDVNDRIRWHAAHSGFRHAAEELFGEAHLRGTALQRAYLVGLLHRVDRYGYDTRWARGCDAAILRDGLLLYGGQGALDHAMTAEIVDSLRDRDWRLWIDGERRRIGHVHRMRIPLSPRELAELDHDHMTQRGHWEPRKTDEYAHLSDDWRLEGEPAWQHGPVADDAKPTDATVRTRLEAMHKPVGVAVDKPAKPDPVAPAQDVVAPADTVAVAPAEDFVDFSRTHFVLGFPSDTECLRLVKAIAGRRLPLSSVPKGFDETYVRFIDSYPHATRIVDRVLGRLREGETARIEPTLIVGDPGCGKSTFWIELASYLHLDATVFPCASVADGSFGGTPAQWLSKRVSTPLQSIIRAGTANPIVILDEIEKTGLSDKNGSLVHALLPMLERHTASQYFETGIETAVDLSAVSFVATANSVEGIPAALLDRFTVLRMPSPGVEHTEALAQTAIRQLRDAHDERPEERPDLAPDELAVIRKAWGGGSLRRLHRIIDATLEAREAHARSRLQ